MDISETELFLIANLKEPSEYNKNVCYYFDGRVWRFVLQLQNNNGVYVCDETMEYGFYYNKLHEDMKFVPTFCDIGPNVCICRSYSEMIYNTAIYFANLCHINEVE